MKSQTPDQLCKLYAFADRSVSCLCLANILMFRLQIPCVFFIVCLSSVLVATPSLGEAIRPAMTFDQQIKLASLEDLAAQARQRGDARRGALVFFTTTAACVNCHTQDSKQSQLGPDLTVARDVSDEHLIESLIHPSKVIHKKYQTQSILTTDGEVIVALVTKETQDTIIVRSADNLEQSHQISKDDIEAMKPNTQSMMPDGLVAVIGNLRDFLDLTRYLMELADGGANRAKDLMPRPHELEIKDDTVNLDHSGIISKLRSRDFETGKGIYHGYCFNCHGTDGNTPSLPTARAFGTDKMRYGSDPYQMFMTLSKGKGLMSAMRHLTPKERYQVIHYVREQFMKPSNPDYFEVDKEYLEKLPKGTLNGSEQPVIARDYGSAMASQLGRQHTSVLNVDLGDTTISYDLHSMDQAGIWTGGLNLSQTQHSRDRGEGTVTPDGKQIQAWSGWAWGHDGSLDYSREQLLPRGPMPAKWMDYKGHYHHGNEVVLSYSIDNRSILEVPNENGTELSHRMQIKGGAPLVLSVGQELTSADPTHPLKTTSTIRNLSDGGNSLETILLTGSSETDFVISYQLDEDRMSRFMAAAVTGDTTGLRWNIDSKKRFCLIFPEDNFTRNVTIHRSRGTDKDTLQRWLATLPSTRAENRLRPIDMISGGPTRWPEVLRTKGYLGLEPAGYALDTIALPDSNPWNSWFRTSALDFFSDGRMALSTYGGDIWVVSGIDKNLTDIRWKRFAAGLYEPFGIKIVDDNIHVTCKDRIVKLHDFNQDGEADYHESFSPDTDVSANFHAFNFDLQTDPQGNFYYSKSGHGADSKLPGAVIKVSADGKQREVYCTGFRTPNGMGMLPDGRPTASDNQGQWTPASKVSLLKPNGFYGWVQTYSIPGMWEPDGGNIDIKKVVPPTAFDPPLIWMPQDFDNSSGGQLWVDDPRWGPLSNHLLHTSFGKGWMSYLMIQDIDGHSQAAIAKLPFDFCTGIMRARVNPIDGQVYATGLQGWNGGGRAGLLDGGIQRIRYTGKPWRMITDCKVEKDGLLIQFNFRLDPKVATEISSYEAEHWNYHWRSSYGSDRYSPLTDQRGSESIKLDSVTLGPDGQTVKLKIPDLMPVDQAHISFRLKSSDGQDFSDEIYWTINHVPKK